MFFKINNVKMPVEAELDEVLDVSAKLLPVAKCDILSLKVLRRGIDARRGNVSFVYTLGGESAVDFSCDGNKIVSVAPIEDEEIPFGNKKMKNRPVIIGFGPCGMFCALTLARRGFRPIVLERGANVDARTKAVENFWQNGILDKSSNVQFGEGGAGTFSDGKLTTRIGDKAVTKILEEFVAHGAPEDILYTSMAHIGTDILKNVVKSIRAEIIESGGEVRFLTKVSEIKTKNNSVKGIKLSDGSEIACDAVVLAIGHSARDTYEMLFSKGISMVQKPFSVGVRAEHLREDIDRAMYGKYAGNATLGAAPYKLSYRENDRGCYSFCMCPGGVVVNASSEEGHLVVNGMSYRARDKINSNSAICVSVSGKDFGTSHPLGAVFFQRQLEKAAYNAGGGDFSVPVQRLGDYFDGRKSVKFGRVKPSVLPKTEFFDLNEIFSPGINDFLKKGFSNFEKKIKGFADFDVLLTGVETRTSAPVRILRNENFQSISASGLYPAGEGAGYAGGIMSAAADGIKVAGEIIKTYTPY